MSEVKTTNSEQAELKEAVDKYLFDIQLARKVSFWQYIFSFKIMVAFFIALFLIYIFGEKNILYIGVGFFGYAFSSYKKCGIDYKFKITKMADRTLFAFFTNLTKRIYKSKREILKGRSLVAGLFLKSIGKEVSNKNES